MNKTGNDFDVVIIGGGAAGLSAALWCDDLGLSALLLEAGAELGGQLLRTHGAIENHLGARAKNGREMRDIFVRQIEKRKFTLKLSCEISEIEAEEKIVSLKNGERFFAKALVVATGIKRRKLNIAGEDRFKNKGIIESGRRAAHLVENKIAAVIGGGDAAFENALILADAATKVFLIHRGENFRARAEFVEQVLANPKIKILKETSVNEIVGNRQVEVIKLRNLKTNEVSEMSIDAILIRVGVEPNTEIFRGKLDLDQSGYIKINELCETSVKGVFAVGDAANPISPTVSSAVGMGATAVKAIFGELNA